MAFWFINMSQSKALDEAIATGRETQVERCEIAVKSLPGSGEPGRARDHLTIIKN